MNLRDKEKNIIISLAKKYIKTPHEIWFYGSRVDGSSHDTSDLDLVIRAHNLQALPCDEFIEFKKNISQSNIPIIVQILDWGRIPSSFQENILKKYEVATSQ
ncbi:MULTISPECIES: nucleotidyltransferase domain-containing protein [Cysteiniphilum]|nr:MULTISPECIES: nucleotidyltransferase domain-containing protein [Cysteiniphilum]